MLKKELVNNISCQMHHKGIFELKLDVFGRFLKDISNFYKEILQYDFYVKVPVYYKIFFVINRNC